METILSWFQSFLSVIKTFEVKDAVDIVCVTAVIYAVIKFVRDTKAVQLLKGLVLFLVVYFMSTLFNLTMFSTLLKMFVEFGVLILIIVFQPEVRNALEKIGRSKFSKTFGFSIPDENEQIVELNKKCVRDVVSIAKTFSQQKVGALIVFERETKLGDIIKTGTIIDALPSVSLLGNMFFNKAPLHDGATIIRNGRVYSAGCILPLTRKNAEVDVNLGTRHRAALGMSEESDAVIVVVSEETGNISLAHHGRLMKMENSNELELRLETLIIPDYTRNDIADFIPIFSAIRKDKKITNEQTTSDEKK
ncbi:MAG: diadenylate cyclase CdaA [Acutalibacteraceae bacterium]|nr:diadenylate cyclase CdaA [Acutalibacteraceae bacterium]